MGLVEKVNNALKLQKMLKILNTPPSSNIDFDKELNKFDKASWTNEIILKYFYKIIDECKNIPNGLRSNTLFLKLYLKCFYSNNKKLYMLNDFNFFAWNDDLIKKYSIDIIYKTNSIPSGLVTSSILLNIYLNNFFTNNHIELLNSFDYFAWTEDIINEYGKEILYKYGAIPNGLKYSSLMLKIYLNSFFINNININLINDFNSNAWTEDIINNYWNMIINKTNNIPIGLITNSFMNKKVINYVIENKKYDIFNNFFQYHNKSNEEKRRICILYKYLLNKNIDILLTLVPNFLTVDLNLSWNEVLVITKEKYLQEIILQMNDKEKNIFAKIMFYLRKYCDNYDVLPILYNVLKNINMYYSFINNIDINNINEEEINNFIMLLQLPENILQISTLEDLTNNGIDSLYNKYFIEIEKKIKKNSLKIDELRKAVLIKRYALNYSRVKFLYDRYCSEINIKFIKNSDNPYKKILIEIYNIFKCKDKKKLIEMFYSKDKLIIDYRTSVYLESSIRALYAKEYSDSLYKLSKKDYFNLSSLDINLEEIKYKSKNEIEEIIKEKNEQRNRILSLKKDDIDVYVLNDDFNLLIHSLKSYSLGKINNYFEDWNKPKICNHGICTSYIRNNLISTAPHKLPILGFDKINSNGLLLLSSNDMASDNTSFASTMEKTGMFLYPDDLINNTRNGYNEMVVERINCTNKECFKTMPSYVVYIIDDINNKYNFMSREEYNSLNEVTHEHEQYIEYFEEVKKCSKEMNIPIVVIDKKHYAKRERTKCDCLYKKFIMTLDVNILEILYNNLFNNITSCMFNSSNNDLFNENIFEMYFYQTLHFIDTMDENNNTFKSVYYNKLKNLLENEYNKEYNAKGHKIYIKKLVLYIKEIDERITSIDLTKKTVRKRNRVH